MSWYNEWQKIGWSKNYKNQSRYQQRWHEDQKLDGKTKKRRFKIYENKYLKKMHPGSV